MNAAIPTFKANGFLVKAFATSGRVSLCSASLLTVLHAHQNASCLWLAYLMNPGAAAHSCPKASLLANKQYFFSFLLCSVWSCGSCTARSPVLLIRDMGISAQAFLWSSLLSHASSNALISVAPERGKEVDVELF